MAKYEEIESIYGVGPIVAKSVYEWFHDNENKKLIKNLLKQVEIEQVKKGDSSSLKLKGKSFVFTGTMKMDRVEAQEIVRKLGGEVMSAVSSKTSYVVSGENAGSKLEKARELGVEVINEERFLEMVK